MGESCSKINFRSQYNTVSTNNVTNRTDTPDACSHPPQLVLGDGAGVHECLRDDREHGVHVVRRLHVEYELGVLHDVDPETQREAAEEEEDQKRPTEIKRRPPGSPPHVTQCESERRPSYLLVFQMCIVSGSEMPCWPAWSSSRSKKYLTASGTGRLVLRMTMKRSSTNFCNVP